MGGWTNNNKDTINWDGTISVNNLEPSEDNHLITRWFSNNNYLKLDGTNSPTAEIDWGTQNLVNVGNVGLGTATPNGKLDVRGDIYIENSSKLIFANSLGTTRSAIIGDTSENILWFTGSPLIQRWKFDTNGNAILGLSGASAGTNAIRVFTIQSGTAPTSQPANQVQFYAEDRGGNDGKTGLVVMGEDGTKSIISDRVGIATTSPDTKLQVVGDCKFGDDNTNYIETSTTGDLVFVGGAGLAFGEIYAYDTNTTITISGTGIANKVQVTAFDTNGASNNTTPDHTNDHITITKAGIYKCDVSCSISSGAGAAFKVGAGVFKNNGATHFTNCHFHRNLSGGGGDTGSASMTGLIDLAANDTIEVWAWNETNTTNLIVDDITLNLVQVGGT